MATIFRRQRRGAHQAGRSVTAPCHSQAVFEQMDSGGFGETGNIPFDGMLHSNQNHRLSLLFATP